MSKVPSLKGIPIRKIVMPEKERLPDPPRTNLIIPGKQVNDDRVKGVSSRLAVGYSETIGGRRTMEDKLVIYGSFRNRSNEDYFAVFDGHNGESAAAFCANHMHNILAEVFVQNFDIVNCFKETFLISNKCLKTAITQGGTTAVVALFKGEELYIANSGDSRAVLCKNNKAKKVTVDHKPTLPEEKERIERAGGYVDHKGTVTGSLAVSRSLGDFGYHPYVTCDPDIFGPYLVFDESYQLLILACDGLWDVVTNEDAVAVALAAPNPAEAAKKLRELATEKDSKDNISVIVIFFPHFKPPDTYTSMPLYKLETSVSQSQAAEPKESLFEFKLKLPNKLNIKVPAKTNGKQTIAQISSSSSSSLSEESNSSPPSSQDESELSNDSCSSRSGSSSNSNTPLDSSRSSCSNSSASSPINSPKPTQKEVT